jgi:hypothetical protein
MYLLTLFFPFKYVGGNRGVLYPPLYNFQKFLNLDFFNTDFLNRVEGVFIVEGVNFNVIEF